MTNTVGDRVLIAGGSGFLGVSLAHHLADRGWAVTILSRKAPRPAGGAPGLLRDRRRLSLAPRRPAATLAA